MNWCQIHRHVFSTAARGSVSVLINNVCFCWQESDSRDWQMTATRLLPGMVLWSVKKTSIVRCLISCHHSQRLRSRDMTVSRTRFHAVVMAISSSQKHLNSPWGPLAGGPGSVVVLSANGELLLVWERTIYHFGHSRVPEVWSYTADDWFDSLLYWVVNNDQSCLLQNNYNGAVLFPKTT